MSKAWTAERLGTDKNGKICYSICCDPNDEPALEKLMEVFFNLEGDSDEV